MPDERNISPSVFGETRNEGPQCPTFFINTLPLLHSAKLTTGITWRKPQNFAQIWSRGHGYIIAVALIQWLFKNVPLICPSGIYSTDSFLQWAQTKEGHSKQLHVHLLVSNPKRTFWFICQCVGNFKGSGNSTILLQVAWVRKSKNRSPSSL